MSNVLVRAERVADRVYKNAKFRTYNGILEVYREKRKEVKKRFGDPLVYINEDVVASFNSWISVEYENERD
jgi:hypothetical protein